MSILNWIWALAQLLGYVISLTLLSLNRCRAAFPVICRLDSSWPTLHLAGLWRVQATGLHSVSSLLMSSPSSVFCSFLIYLTVVLADRWCMGSGVCEVSDCSPSVFLLFLALFFADDGKGQLRKAEVWFGCSQREDEERSQGGRSVKCTVKIGVHKFRNTPNPFPLLPWPGVYHMDEKNGFSLCVTGNSPNTQTQCLHDKHACSHLHV